MAEAEPERVVVTIYGKTYTFAASEQQSADHIREVARLVDERMRQAAREHHGLSPVQAAVAAGLNLVDELLNLQADYQVTESDIAQRTSRLAASVSRVFQESRLEPAPAVEKP
jgi:cell division protein ZapA